MGLLQAGSNPAGAQAAYEKAMAIQPNFAPGQRELGIALLQQKNYAAAAPHLQKTVLGPGRCAFTQFSRHLLQPNRFEEAVKSYRTALQMDPNLCPRSDLLLTVAYLERGFRRLAFACSRSASAVLPS